jgi:putative nucleotidyltransferase with HDIG domain
MSRSALKFDEAVRLLRSHGGEDAAFVRHSHAVADVATRLGTAIAERKEGVDLETLRVRALLHDFGRSKTHGHYHGWVGYAMLRHRGLAHAGRACITHWLRNMELDEVVALSQARPKFIRRVFEELELPALELDDVLISVADFSVAHTTVVSIEAREQDLKRRYGPSRWLRRNADLAREHRAQIERLLQCKLSDIVPETARGVEHVEFVDYQKALPR